MINESDKLRNSIGIVETKSVRVVGQDDPMTLRCGKTLGPIDVAYETYGTLNADGSNVILICHALSGNAHVAGYHSEDDKTPGWWDIMVGPGKAIDTDKYYVICSNILGGCSGTTGPGQINPETGKPFGLDFPIITIADMVEVQKRLLDKLGVKHILAVIGGSVGGMQVIQWAISYPEFADTAIVIASTTRLGAQSIAFDTVGRNAILADAGFEDGQYHGNKGPSDGLSIARMIGHITYLSEESMRRKFGRELRDAKAYTYDFKSEFAVETYLDYKGQSFVDTFDANSYLYITKAMDYFDPAQEHGSLQKAFAKTTTRFLITSFTSDWLFRPEQSEEIMDALAANGKDVSYCCIDSPYGHDAFLLEPETLGALIKGAVDSSLQKKSSGSHLTDSASPRVLPDMSIHETVKRARVDYELIDQLIEPGSKVLDVGSGDGDLLKKLIEDKNVNCEGIELDQDMVVHSISRGLSVIHRDIERGLSLYADDSFDYAVLSQTLQTVKEPAKVFAELLRVARKVIVSFPNFGHIGCRLQLLFKGHAPMTKQLPFTWHDTPNIHCLSLKDFDRFCEEIGAKVEQRIPLKKNSQKPVTFLPNLLAEQAVYVTSKKV